jgi:integrase/recombinase XerD
MEYSTIRKILLRAVQNAGITKHVHPHLFRDSRITHMVSQGYQESVIKESMWGNVTTEMFRTYVKLSEQNIDDEFLSKAGIEVKKEEKEEPIKPRLCGNCHHHNAPTDNFCSKCGFGLTDDAKGEVKTAKDLLFELLSGPEGLEFVSDLKDYQERKQIG